LVELKIRGGPEKPNFEPPNSGSSQAGLFTDAALEVFMTTYNSIQYNSIYTKKGLDFIVT
jgi:hypothetical protein